MDEKTPVLMVGGVAIPYREVSFSTSRRPYRVVDWTDVPENLRKDAGEPTGCEAATWYGALGPLTKMRHCGQKPNPGERFCPMHGGAKKPPRPTATKATEKEREARSRLIAAALDLLTALEELVDLMEAVRSGEYLPDSFTTQPARTALAKAKGLDTKKEAAPEEATQVV